MKKAKNLSLSPEILEKADALRKLLHQDKLSGLISRLIIDEWERRHGPLRFSESMEAIHPGPKPQTGPYRLRRRRRPKKDPPASPGGAKAVA